MKKYILTITYNFDSDYIVASFDTEKESVEALNEALNEEVETVIKENKYEPSVIRFGYDDVVLVYAEGYPDITDGSYRKYRKDYPMEDCAMYRIFEVEF